MGDRFCQVPDNRLDNRQCHTHTWRTREDFIRDKLPDLLTAALSAAWPEADSGPDDPYYAFAYFVGKCGEGFGAELLKQGRTDIEARNIIIGCFIDFAAGEACRQARREGREPDHQKWTKAVDGAFERAVKRTLPPPPASEIEERE